MSMDDWRTVCLTKTARSWRIIMVLLCSALLFPVIIYGYEIDFNQGLVQRISAIEFQGAVYDVTFGVPTTLLFLPEMGYVTSQVVVPWERQLPADAGLDFFGLVTDILNKPFFDCARNHDCQENSGDAYGIIGSSHWLDFNVFSHGQWQMGAYYYGGFWFPDQALTVTGNINPMDPYFNGPLHPRIAFVEKAAPVPEASTLVLLAFGMMVSVVHVTGKTRSCPI